MNSRRLRVFGMVCLIVISLVLSGCWNRREPEVLALVLGTAFDYDPATGLYKAIIQTANPAGLGDAGGQGAGGGAGALRRPFWTVSASGRTPFEAMRNLAQKSSRDIYWAHSRVVLLSEALVQKGIGPLLDLYERERQLRPVALPIVTRGDIEQLMKAEFPLDGVGSRALSRGVRTLPLQQSVFPTLPLNSVYRLLDRPGQQLLIGTITVIPEWALSPGASGSQSAVIPPDQMPVRFGGAAYFRGDKFAGWASERDVQGFMYATGQAFRSVHIVPDPLDSTALLSVELLSSSAEMRSEVAGEDIRIRIEIRALGRMQNMTNTTGVVVDAEYILKAQHSVANDVRQSVESLVNRSKELGSDVLGIGHLIYRKHPKLWEKIKHRWDEILPLVQVDTIVKVNIARPGLVVSPLRSQGGR